MAADAYAVLGVDPGAPVKVVREKYLEAMLRYHPDKCGDDAEARRMFLAAKAAWETLKDGHDDAADRVESRPAFTAVTVRLCECDADTDADVFTFPCRCGGLFTLSGMCARLCLLPYRVTKVCVCPQVRSLTRASTRCSARRAPRLRDLWTRTRSRDRIGLAVCGMYVDVACRIEKGV
jgi:hypothetical protein